MAGNGEIIRVTDSWAAETGLRNALYHFINSNQATRDHFQASIAKIKEALAQLEADQNSVPEQK